MKGQPTSLNVFALRQLFGATHRVSARVSAVVAPHICRCLDAGLVAVDGRDLVLTPAGLEATSEAA